MPLTILLIWEFVCLPLRIKDIGMTTQRYVALNIFIFLSFDQRKPLGFWQSSPWWGHLDVVEKGSCWKKKTNRKTNWDPIQSSWSGKFSCTKTLLFHQPHHICRQTVEYKSRFENIKAIAFLFLVFLNWSQILQALFYLAKLCSGHIKRRSETVCMHKIT